jgi:hypothetical protein
MKITLDQFRKIFEKAEAHFGIKNLNSKAYYNKVQYFEPSIVAEAVNGLVDTAPPLLSRFPTPVALLMACKDAAGRRREDTKPKSYGCDAEGCINGFVMFCRIINGHRTHASNPCAKCFPSHAYPQVTIVDHTPAHTCRKEGKKYKADFTNIRYIENSQYLDEKEFVEHLENRRSHAVPGEVIPEPKPKPTQNQAFRELPTPGMVKAQAQEMLKNSAI